MTDLTRPHELMIFGSLMAVFGLLMSFISPWPSFSLIAFFGGAILGKGYGIWQERQALASKGGEQIE